MAIKLKGDKDGFIGRYVSDCGTYTWEVTKHYHGKGLGASWLIQGPFMGRDAWRGYGQMITQLECWKQEGVRKAAA